MKTPLKILILEDNSADAEILQWLLKKEKMNCQFYLAINKSSYLLALNEFVPDIILSDHSLPQFSSSDALAAARKIFPDIPFIMVTGTISEEFAADIIKAGADDYILKDRLNRLPAAIDAALKSRYVEKEKQDALKKLIQSEEKYRTIFLKSPLPKWIYDEETLRFLEVNNAAIQHYGYTLEEFLGMTIKDIRPAEDVDMLLNDISKIPLEPDSRQSNWRHLKKNGEVAIVETTAHSIDYNNGKARMVIINDITERKHAEQQKEFDTNNLNALINNTDDIMWSIDCNYNLITANDAFNQLYILICGEKPVKGGNVFITEFTEKQKNLYRKFYERACSGETFTEIDNSLTGYWSEVSFHPIREDKQVIGTACFSRNITDRINAEEKLAESYAEKQSLAQRLSAIINTLPANIALLNDSGAIIDVNDSWRNFADDNGFNGGNYCIGDNYLDISKMASGKEKDDGLKVSAGITSVLKNKAKDFVFEYGCDAPGINRWFRMVVTALSEKEYSGAVVMHIDISELRRLEKERLQSKVAEQKKITQAMLRGQEKERNHIGQELHDNINQILAGTKLFLGSAGSKNPELKELIKYPMELIDASIEEIRSLCSKLVTPLKNINLEVLIGELLNKINQNSDTQSSFSYDLPQSLPDDLKLNIYRIIQSQVSNIIKYAGAKNVHVTAHTQGGQVNVLISDDGKGFDVDAKRGGIGLSNMINRVESFNGEVQIKSSPGNGCTIIISMPY